MKRIGITSNRQLGRLELGLMPLIEHELIFRIYIYKVFQVIRRILGIFYVGFSIILSTLLFG